MVYNADTDLNLDQTNNFIRSIVTHVKGKMLFDPDTYKNCKDDLTVEANQLTLEQIKVYARTCTELRVKFSEKAQTLARTLDGREDENSLEEIKEPKKLKRGFCRKKDTSQNFQV